MNDFERKLSQQPFRTPPADLRDALFGSPSRVIVPPAWTWRDWLWPSPYAWGALAAIWVMFAAVSTESTAPEAPSSDIAQQPAGSVTLLAFHQSRHLDYVLELPN